MVFKGTERRPDPVDISAQIESTGGMINAGTEQERLTVYWCKLRLEYKKTEQLHLSIALPGLALDDPDIYALDLLSVILGEGMSSRLFVELRENRGLAYDVHSGVSHFRDTGAFIISAGVDPASAYEAGPAILEQVASVRDSIDEREVERAKQLVAGRLMLRMEDTRAVSAWMGSQEMVRGEMLDVDHVVQRVEAVTSEDLCAEWLPRIWSMTTSTLRSWGHAGAISACRGS
ncbi:Uncharacterized zinc protease SCO5738 [Geodia barretti]|uniref:Uncharacterized zinc protease SCO5738 n=1 Tax=Geodia barretti TaxID=519541 RepID=A0AA35XE95_GEOBA|nr:Uncharacterized zinc protease SCO5738 [Geodia barretti]